jgi:hypothetical protein
VERKRKRKEKETRWNELPAASVAPASGGGRDADQISAAHLDDICCEKVQRLELVEAERRARAGEQRRTTGGVLL